MDKYMSWNRTRQKTDTVIACLPLLLPQGKSSSYLLTDHYPQLPENLKAKWPIMTKPGKRSHRTSYGTNAAPSTVRMQSPCQFSTHSSTIHPTPLLFQWLFSTFPLLCKHQVIQKLLGDQKCCQFPWLQPLLKTLECYPWHLHSVLWEVLSVQPRNSIFLWCCLHLRSSGTPGVGSLGWRIRWGDNTLTCYHQRLPHKASPINTPPPGLCSRQKCYTRSSLVLFANPVGKENKIYKDSVLKLEKMKPPLNTKKNKLKRVFIKLLCPTVCLLLQLWPHELGEKQKVEEYLLLIQRCLGKIRSGDCKTSVTKE